MIVKQSDIEGIIKAASQELAAFLEPLNKAEDKKEVSPEESKDESASASPVPEKSASAESSVPPPPAVEASESEETPEESSDESAEAAEGDVPPVDADESAEGEAVEEEPSAEGEAPGALEAMYSGMPVDMLKAHYVALKKVIFAKHKLGLAEGASETDEAPPTDPAAVGVESAPPQSIGSPDMDMDKSEKSVEKAAAPMECSEPEMSKKEEELKMDELKKTEALEAEVADLKKSLDGVLKVLEKVVRPERKAVTSLEGLTKTEDVTVTTEEARKQLAQLALHPEELKKSDREAILGFYEGRIDLSGVKHLLKK